MYHLSDQEEEILESLWTEIEEKKNVPDLVLLKNVPAFRDLLEKGLLVVDNPRLFSPEGLIEAKGCVRRHRLAERLLSDILNVRDPLMHEAGCKFEHGLHHGLEDNICTLLGHPRNCPHGRLIPAGKCCEIAKKHTEPLIVSLSHLSPQDAGKISYINIQDKEVLKKLLSMGILPGNQIKLLHRFPSFIFEMNNSNFAVDKDLADHIHVLILIKGKP